MARITDEQMMVRCWENGLRIYPKPIENNNKQVLVLEYQNQYQYGKTIYNQTKKDNEIMSDKMRELYVEVYFRYKHKFKDKSYTYDFLKKEYIKKEI
jgi:hypothetical protein